METGTPPIWEATPGAPFEAMSVVDAGAKLLRGLLDVFVLESLETSPKHGYALLREMAEAFGTTPNRNRLYPLLGRMVGEGLIAERSEPNGARTLYALTDAGRDTLAAYRRLPPSFRQRVARLWGIGQVTAPTTTTTPTREPAPRAPSLTLVPSAPHASPEGAPYPCVDARVLVEKDPRTGNTSIRLTGCPMGAYDYCTLCPVHAALDGIRKITFS